MQHDVQSPFSRKHTFSQSFFFVTADAHVFDTLATSFCGVFVLVCLCHSRCLFFKKLCMFFGNPFWSERMTAPTAKEDPSVTATPMSDKTEQKQKDTQAIEEDDEFEEFETGA